MTPDLWQRTQQIYHAALERDVSQRADFLDQACAGDAELRREVESLLAAHLQASDFLITPALAVEAREVAAEQARLLTGQQIGHYQIVAWLGAGGMGEVYLAHDSRLDRKVALKLLPARFTQDVEQARRFAREAKAASALNHPNIITIYEIGEAGEIRFIAAEFIEGGTLRQRLKAGRLELREALEIALQVAAALAAAHQAGIVHRDVKPENIMLRPDGLVKVLDFGLARMPEPAALAADDQTANSTEAGAVLGTPRYMSPEQARGIKVDALADIFSFGVVLYEMIAARPPFTGATAAEVFAALLTKEPEPLSQRAAGASAELQGIVSKALAKERPQRYQTIRDLQRDLQAQLARLNQPVWQTSPSHVLETQRVHLPVRSFAWRRWGVVAGGMLAALLIAGVGWQFLHRSATPSESELRSSLHISELLNVPNLAGRGLSDLSFSPNGKLVAYSLSKDDEAHLWIKQMTGGEPKQITEGEYRDQSPIWSPDGEELAFVSNRGGAPGIWSMPYLGGTPRQLSRLESIESFLTGWSQNRQTIYFGSKHNLYALDLTARQISSLTRFDYQHSSAQYFKVSPDERQIAYVDFVDKQSRILVLPLRGGKARQISSGEGKDYRFPVWFPDGTKIAYSSRRDNIIHIYLAWLDGRAPVQITFGSEDYERPAVSPDGTKILAISTKSNANLFSCDLRTGSESKLTSEFNLQLSPDISPDGESIVFQSTRSVSRTDDSLFVQSRAAGSHSRPLVSNGTDAKWSPVEGKLAFIRNADRQAELWSVNAGGGDEQRLTTGVLVWNLTLVPFNRFSPNYNWSPDGRQIAYFSNKSGQWNIWAVASDGTSDAMISNNTDPKPIITSPFWSPHGERIAYVAQSGGKRSVCVTAQGKTDTVYEGDKPLRLIGWSPSGKEILVALAEGNGSTAPQEISLLRAAIGAEKRKTIARIRAAYLHNIKLSHDGRVIVFASRQDGKNNVAVIPASGGPVRKVTSNNDPTIYYSGLTWSPDGKTLFYSKQTDWTLVSLIENLK